MYDKLLILSQYLSKGNIMDTVTKLIILAKAENYLQENPERFNSAEKSNFKIQLNNYLANSDKVYDDNVYDFLIHYQLIKNTNRHIQFSKYLLKKYSPSTHPEVLDVGAGRMCHLSSRLGRSNFNTTAIDPMIRLDKSEAREKKIKEIITDKFYCDEYSPNSHIATNINNYDLIVGLEPCDATEHIIRQSLKYDKPFEISLCATHHTPLDNKIVRSTDEWYNYLKSISSEVHIQHIPGYYVATNNM